MSLEGSPDLIARALVNVEPIVGLKALQRGQRYSSLVSERLLRPIQQRAYGPRLSGGDHDDHFPPRAVSAPELRL